MTRAALRNQPIPFLTLPNWAKAAAICGFNIEPIFARLGVRTDLAQLQDATITLPVLGEVMSACVAESRSRYFPFVLGETFAFDYLPDIGTFLATSSSLREACQVFDWVRDLINPMIDFRLRESGDQASLVLNRARVETDVDRYFVESVFASLARFGRQLLGDLDRFSGMRLSYPMPREAPQYERYFGLPVRFGQDCNAFDMSRGLLDARLDGGFPELHRQAGQRVVQLLARMPRRTGLVAAVEAALDDRSELLSAGIDVVAGRFGMQARTLQRRLRSEGETYGQLLDRVRYRSALRLLQDESLDIETISERLGFSDRRSFTRAFTRWSGVSPSSFRGRRSG